MEHECGIPQPEDAPSIESPPDAGTMAEFDQHDHVHRGHHSGHREVGVGHKSIGEFE